MGALPPTEKIPLRLKSNRQFRISRCRSMCPRRALHCRAEIPLAPRRSRNFLRPDSTLPLKTWPHSKPWRRDQSAAAILCHHLVPQSAPSDVAHLQKLSPRSTCQSYWELALEPGRRNTSVRSVRETHSGQCRLTNDPPSPGFGVASE